MHHLLLPGRKDAFFPLVFWRKIRFLRWQELLLEFLLFLVQESLTHICVLCVLYEYIWKELERLFIFYIKSFDTEIGPSTISRWIVDTVRFAYDQKPQFFFKQGLCTWAKSFKLKFKFCLVERCPNGFSSQRRLLAVWNSFIIFYLGDSAGLNTKLFSMVPTMASQKVISSTV